MSKPIEPIYRVLGNRIEYMRTALGWTQEELAKKSGHYRTSIVNMEKGRHRIMLHDVDRIASAFGCTLKHFLRGIMP